MCFKGPIDAVNIIMHVFYIQNRDHILGFIATHKGLDMDASICNEMVMTLGDFFISKGL